MAEYQPLGNNFLDFFPCFFCQSREKHVLIKVPSKSGNHISEKSRVKLLIWNKSKSCLCKWSHLFSAFSTKCQIGPFLSTFYMSQNNQHHFHVLKIMHIAQFGKDFNNFHLFFFQILHLCFNRDFRKFSNDEMTKLFLKRGKNTRKSLF